MRREHSIALLAFAAAFLCGCQRHDNKETFYLVSANAALPYWQTAASGFKHAAEQYKVTAKVVGPDNYDVQAELDALQKAAATKPGGILVSVSDAAAMQPAIDAAVNAGVPVITIDSDAASSRRLFFIGTNNLEAGRLAGHRLADRLKKGNVVVFTIAGQPNTDERLKGLRDSLSFNPGINFVDVIDVKGDPRVAFDRTQSLLDQTGAKKVDAFVCLESASGKMVGDALKRSKATDRLLIAWDVNQDTLNGIKDGSIDATIAQKPYTMGYVGMKALDEILHYPPKDLTRDYSADSFSPYPVFVDTGTSVVDKSSVDLYIANAQNGTR